jgi:amino acid transporter
VETVPQAKESVESSMTLTETLSMGVGAMVGAGIFALMGDAGSIAGNAVYISFIIAGVISLLSGYSYSKLGVRYPSSGGIVEYLIQAFGGGYLTGVLSVTLYFSVTIVMAMVAKAFGSYAAALLFKQPSVLTVNLLGSAIVLVLLAINFMGSKLVGEVEKFFVILKLTVLGGFIVAGTWLLNPELIQLKNGDSAPLAILSATAICLLAYHGFGVITNTVGHMDDPAKTLPRAIFGAIGIVILVYVGASFAVFGNLPLPEIIRAKDYAMAEAARPIFGAFGFTVIAIAAMISSATSINANLYSTANITFLLAKDGELPPFECKRIWHAGTGGLLTTGVFILLITNFFDLSKIAAMGSIVYLIIYSAVHFGHLKSLTHETGASWTLVFLALISNTAILLIFVVQIARTNPTVLYFLILILLPILLFEAYMQKVKNRSFKTTASFRCSQEEGVL